MSDENITEPGACTEVSTDSKTQGPQQSQTIKDIQDLQMRRYL